MDVCAIWSKSSLGAHWIIKHTMFVQADSVDSILIWMRGCYVLHGISIKWRKGGMLVTECIKNIDEIWKIDRNNRTKFEIRFKNRNKYLKKKTCLCNFDPLKPYFYIVKLRFTGYTLFFSVLLKNLCFEQKYEKNQSLFICKFSVFGDVIFNTFEYVCFRNVYVPIFTIYYGATRESTLHRLVNLMLIRLDQCVDRSAPFLFVYDIRDIISRCGLYLSLGALPFVGTVTPPFWYSHPKVGYRTQQHPLWDSHI